MSSVFVIVKKNKEYSDEGGGWEYEIVDTAKNESVANKLCEMYSLQNELADKPETRIEYEVESFWSEGWDAWKEQELKELRHEKAKRDEAIIIDREARLAARTPEEVERDRLNEIRDKEFSQWFTTTINNAIKKDLFSRAAKNKLDDVVGGDWYGYNESRKNE